MTDYNLKFLHDLGVSFKRPNILYHYTNHNGLIGILKSKDIWASHIQYLNDAKEFKYAADLIRKKFSLSFKKLETSHRDSLSKLIDMSNILRQYQIFVTSFSEEGNLLSQWRAYCPEFNGYSIGFPFSSINYLIDNQNGIKYYLFPCIYDKITQNKIIEKLKENFINGVIGSLEKTIKSLEKTEEQISLHLTNVLKEYTLQYLIISSIMKKSKFDEEKEWRLFALDKKDNSKQKINFRISNSLLIPYIKFGNTPGKMH